MRSGSRTDLDDGSDDDQGPTVHDSGDFSAEPTNPTDDTPQWADWRAGLLF